MLHLSLFAGLLTGCLGAYLAYRQDRNPYGWFFIGFFFGLWGALAVCLVPKKKAPVAMAEVPPPPPSILRGPADKFWYYLDGSHQQVGPMSHHALTTEWRQGKISLTTYVWHEELPEWKLLKEFAPTSSP